MAFESKQARHGSDGWGTMAALVAADGSATHNVVRLLAVRGAAMRDLADAVHAFGALHGRQPGIIEHALQRASQPVATEWLEEAAQGFTIERTYLTTLTAAAGPMPSTPGQAESEAAIVGQRHALDMLAQSDRAGCATGAAIALMLDWQAIRGILDVAAIRFGVTPPASAMPHPAETATIVSMLADSVGVERAMAFGTQQLLAQHRGLWDLLEARASARNQG